MRRYKNGTIKFDADDMQALQVPKDQPLTEGQIAFLQSVAGFSPTGKLGQTGC